MITAHTHTFLVDPAAPALSSYPRSVNDGLCPSYSQMNTDEDQLNYLNLHPHCLNTSDSVCPLSPSPFSQDNVFLINEFELGYYNPAVVSYMSGQCSRVYKKANVGVKSYHHNVLSLCSKGSAFASESSKGVLSLLSYLKMVSPLLDLTKLVL